MNSIEVKRICTAIVMLIVWITFMYLAPSMVVTFAVSALAGWYIGGLIFRATVALFPSEDDE
jgi:hypothetical protein